MTMHSTKPDGTQYQRISGRSANPTRGEKDGRKELQSYGGPSGRIATFDPALLEKFKRFTRASSIMIAVKIKGHWVTFYWHMSRSILSVYCGGWRMMSFFTAHFLPLRTGNATRSLDLTHRYRSSKACFEQQRRNARTALRVTRSATR